MKYMLYKMVTQKTLCTYEGKKGLKKIRFATSVDLNKRFKHIKLPILLGKCAPISDLPTNISTMEVCKVSYSYKIRINLLYYSYFSQFKLNTIKT